MGISRQQLKKRVRDKATRDSRLDSLSILWFVASRTFKNNIQRFVAKLLRLVIDTRLTLLQQRRAAILQSPVTSLRHVYY